MSSVISERQINYAQEATAYQQLRQRYLLKALDAYASGNDVEFEYSRQVCQKADKDIQGIGMTILHHAMIEELCEIQEQSNNARVNPHVGRFYFVPNVAEDYCEN